MLETEYSDFGGVNTMLVDALDPKVTSAVHQQAWY